VRVFKLNFAYELAQFGRGGGCRFDKCFSQTFFTASVFIWWANLVRNLIICSLNLSNFNLYLAEFNYFAIARVGYFIEI